MSYCFIVSLVIVLSFPHSIQDKTVITVDGKDGDDKMCQNVKENVPRICKTLDVALDVVKGNNAIITVKILNGTYYHNVTLNSTIIRNGITIFGNNSNTTIIKCNDGAGFGFINASNINISELTLSGCGELRDSTTLNAAFNATIPFQAALYFLNVVNVIIESVAVINSNGMGVAMYDVTGNVNINNSIFRNNSILSQEYPGGGGFSVEFTFCKPGVVKLLNETSTNNNSVYMFYNCTFESNVATTVDTSETTYATNAYGLSNQQFGRGGGLSVFFKGKAFRNTVTVHSCAFTGNHAIWGGGFHSDIVDHSKNNSLKIINSTFDHNQCPFDDADENGLLSVNTGGGAIRIALLFFDTRASVLYNSVTIKQCNFSHNTAYYGGAVSYKITKEAEQKVASNTVNFSDCRWLKNKARTGSAVNLEAQPFPLGVTPYTTFNDCSFLNNTNHYWKSSDKPVGIGALYSDNIPVVFTGDCSFSYNKGTAVTGSATFFILANNSVTTFDRNVGNNGGAIALLGNTYIILDQNTTVWFIENKAYGKGGAIYYVSNSERDFISTQKCFIFYSDRSANHGQWNASVHFQNNTDLLNKSIYATTLLPCVWGNLPGSTRVNSLSLDLLFNQTFHFVNSQRPTIGSNAMTDAINITVNEHSTPVEVPPGRLYKFNIISYDELGNIVEPIFFVQTSRPNVSAVDSTTVYIYDNHIRLYGQPHSNVKLHLQTFSGRPWSFTINVTLSKCPPGFYHHNASDIQDCKCICTTDGYHGIYQCESIKLLAYLYPYFWGGIISEKGELVFVTADCPQGYCNISIPSPPLPIDLSVNANAAFEVEECLYRNRTLCGRCITGYCVATNSPSYECINTASSSLNKYGILWLIILKYIPFTIFLLLIVFFNVSLVDGPLNSFILFTQIINSVGSVPNDVNIHLNDLNGVKKTKLVSNIYYFLYGPWNSNYFEMLVPDFCAYKFDSTIKVLMFEYIPALFPLVLFVLFYSIIPCITNCLVNSEADMPRRCLLKVERMFIIFRRTWSIKNSIIHGLTTFLVLSYAKVTTVTGLLLASTTLYGHLGAAVKTVVRLDGTMDHFGTEHLPYACVAFVLLFTIIVLPPLLLLSYPLLPNLINELNLQDKWIFKTLLIKPLDKCVPFFDAFQSCFKNKYRFFAGLYFLYRAMAVALITFQWPMTVRLIYQQGFFLLIVLIHCVCQPYKLRKYNILDGCIFVILAAINSLSLYNAFNAEIYLNTSQVSFWIQQILIYTPFVYFIVFFFYYVSNRFAPCINKVKQAFCYCLSKCGIQTFTPTNNDEVPARLLDTSSSSGSSESSSSSEEEDNAENEPQNVEMRLPVECIDHSSSSVNHSPYLLGNRRNRFTT